MKIKNVSKSINSLGPPGMVGIYDTLVTKYNDPTVIQSRKEF